MGLFRKMRAMFHEDWCNLCQSEMDVLHKQLYALPDMMVGHYISHESPEYYKNHLVPVAKKAEIPSGMYACGCHAYRCPQCGNRRTKLTIFLPVRDQEKIEEIIFFDHGELDGFLSAGSRQAAAFTQVFDGCREGKRPDGLWHKGSNNQQESAICSHRDPYGY